MENANFDAIAVMLKAPDPGHVKTRLVPPLTDRQAAELYECFIRDTFDKLSTIDDVDVFAAYTPAGAEDRLKDIVPNGVGFIQQEGLDLGDRMCNVFKRLLGMGYKKVALIGADVPDLPAEYVTEAFLLLDGEARLVLGPAADGGYYLVAAASVFGPLFTGIKYGTRTVLEETIEKARENGIEYRLIGRWHDIDTPEDIRLLKDNDWAPLSSAYVSMLDIPL